MLAAAKAIEKQTCWYLLFLDDVWNENHVKWVELRDLIEIGADGSKIPVTTYNHFVASMMVPFPLLF